MPVVVVSQVSGYLDRSVESDIAPHLRLHERSSLTHLPYSTVRLLPLRCGLVRRIFHEIFVHLLSGPSQSPVKIIHGISEDSINIQLNLSIGSVSYSHGARTSIPFEMVQSKFRDLPLAPNAHHYLQFLLRVTSNIDHPSCVFEGFPSGSSLAQCPD